MLLAVSGGADSVARHHEAGKLTARERIEKVLDQETFRETGVLTGAARYDEQGNLVGTLEMPLAVGTVGGATRVHPTARAALRLMDVQTAAELAEIIVSVGLAQNLAALRALATEGIQRGHMGLHARQVAIAAGAQGEIIERLASRLVAEKTVRVDRAQEILQEWQKQG